MIERHLNGKYNLLGTYSFFSLGLFEFKLTELSDDISL